ncbi:MAG TPA: pyridoxal phosphate-dependent aminotransferase [Modestobacter sp.]|nr:pyridoxal phosphate-dependent aminotransferase [Modestobacter sp.]
MTTAPVPDHTAVPVPVTATGPAVLAAADRRVSRRVAAITASATPALDARVAALRAADLPVIDLADGAPGSPTPPHVVAAAVAAAQDPAHHRPAPPGGLPELKAAIVATTLRDSGLSARPADVLVTNGGTQAVAEALATLLDPGDEVLLPTPYWPSHLEAVRLAGGVPVPVVADEASGYLVSVGQLEAARTARTRLLLFSSPANATGAVQPPEEVAEIGRWALAAGLWVLTDETHQHLVYGGATAPSLPGLVPELQPHCLVVNGVSSTYAMAGWPVGWLLGPADVVAAATALQAHSSSPVAIVSQVAAIAALTGDQSAVATQRAALDRRRQTVVGMLRQIPGVACPEPQGAFSVYPSVKALLGRPIAGHTVQTSLELAELLLEEAQVAVVPGEAFGTPGYLRLSYAVSEEDLVEGVGRMQRLLGTAA